MMALVAVHEERSKPARMMYLTMWWVPSAMMHKDILTRCHSADLVLLDLPPNYEPKVLLPFVSSDLVSSTFGFFHSR